MKPQTYKKISAILSGFLSFVSLAILFVPTLAFSDNQQTYTLLAPLPSIGQTYTPSNFPNYLNQMVKLLIILAAILGVMRITVGGLKYMTTEAFSEKGNAKETIKGVAVGLLLLAGAFLILNTINPAILSFNLNPVSVYAPTTVVSDTERINFTNRIISEGIDKVNDGLEASNQPKLSASQIGNTICTGKGQIDVVTGTNYVTVTSNIHGGDVGVSCNYYQTLSDCQKYLPGIKKNYDIVGNIECYSSK
jgi:hypothetical protein